MRDKQALYRMIPAVDQLLSTPRIKTLSAAYPRSLVRRAIDRILDDARDSITRGRIEDEAFLGADAILTRIGELLARMDRPALRTVINATGVVVHTNLGRSLLSERVLRRFRPLAGGYSNLEYDLEQGKRGSRYVHVEGILKELTSAEAVMVVNNNAAAVLVALETLAKGREIVVSRGQLVEIGGSFRIPEVMRKSGALMVEVGTTNKTHLRDYEEVIGPDTALLLKVHTSNYQILGFTQEVPLPELSRLGRRYGIPVMEDLGSGCLVDFSRFGLQGEPTVQEALAQGADLVTFSGDKLLGGPQAGIILGRKDLVEAIRRNQLNRALRIDKLTLLALEETLRAYRDMDAAVREIPTLRMICQPYGSLAKKAERLLRMVGKVTKANFSLDLVDGSSRAGGGALPTLALPSRLISLAPKRLSAQYMESWLRSYDPPIISRLEKDCLLMDMRTIQERELKITARAIRDLAALGGTPAGPA